MPETTTKRRPKSAAVAIDSEALRVNLAETAATGLTIDPAHAVLTEVVAGYEGIRSNLEELLLEIGHPFRNWGHIIPSLRAFVLRNMRYYQGHARGEEALARFADIFCQALAESVRNHELFSRTLEALLAVVEKLATLLDRENARRFEPLFSSCFSRLRDLDDDSLILLAQGRHSMRRIMTRLLELTAPGPEKAGLDLAPAATLMQRLLLLNYRYWLDEADPLDWFTEQCGDLCRGWQAGQFFQAISHTRLQDHLQEAAGIAVAEDPRQALEELLALPAHMDIVRLYRDIPARLAEAAGKGQEEGADRFSENRRLLFLFRIMETAGLTLIHEETLREINHGLVQLIRRQSFEEIERFLLTTLQLLKVNVRKYPHTSLQCIQVLGTEVFKRGNSRLVETFLWETVRFGFQYASVVGVGEDWQPITNPAHLTNIRVWLNLIMQEPKWCSTLFSALIINLTLSGTCVKDTDLFQRDITRLLNHPIEPIYNLFKQFAKLMPVFFNEIGAEGALRDVSTRLDEIHKRKDLLIHFLRKQSHVESSNLIVDFIQTIFCFWKTRDREPLRPFLPEEVLAQINDRSPFIDDLNCLMRNLFRDTDIQRVEDLLSWPDVDRRAFLDRQREVAETERSRFELLLSMYKLVYLKYRLGFQEIRHHLEQAVDSGFPAMTQLLADLESCDTIRCLNVLLTQLEELKKIILSGEIFEASEDIYYKRHIAVDIPSVYGRYRERKFDALSLSFRLENLANIYLEKLPSTVNLSFITRATFIRIVKCFRLYLRALQIDGISSRRLEAQVALLSSSLGVKRFSYTQYLDIFRGLSSGVKDVIYAYYTNLHENNLSIISPQIGAANLLVRYRSLWDEEDMTGTVQRLSESFFRTSIASTFGLQHLDNFITRIIQTLESQKELLDEASLDLLMTYNPEKAISFLHHPNSSTNDLIHLGNKGYNLTQLAEERKPVPPGFIITTEIFRCWPVVRGFSRARDELMRQIRESITKLEETTGRRYGDSKNPLLLSVRSGAAISMPGMMTTIHNVGLNQEIVEEFVRATGKEYQAWDNYRRFLQSWAMAKDMDRERFQELMNGAKARHGVVVKRDFTPAQMKELALEYQKSIRNVGIGIPDDPWLQVVGAVEMVLESWNAKKTREYRALMDTSDAWGTAVILQTMVFGNLGPQSGSGVLFTAHPYRKVRRVALWGDYAINDQGEDIVSGLVTTYPISEEQAAIDGRSAELSLEKQFPRVYDALLALSRELVYEKQWDPQEIEFTFEGPEAGDIYILQTRDMITIKKKESLNIFLETESLAAGLLGRGIGVSGSALTGRAVFTIDNISQLRRQDPEARLILIRQDTVPEDIKAISMADGLLTARGGQTSHAAVVATQLEKDCVVGCKALKVYEAAQYCEINGQTIRFGDPVSIDGRKGLFLKGRHRISSEVHILPI